MAEKTLTTRLQLNRGNTMDMMIHESDILKDGEVYLYDTGANGTYTALYIGDDSSNLAGLRTKGNYFSLVPACSTLNNDQFLKCVSGKPAWVTVPNAEDNSF